MSNESIPQAENHAIQNNEETDSLSKNVSQPKRADQQNDIDSLKQKAINDTINYSEIINVPFLKKKIQAKSKIEIHNSNNSGPISPYTIFLKHMHTLLIDANKEITFSQRSVLIANLWAMMSEKDKEPFKYSARMVNSSNI